MGQLWAGMWCDLNYVSGCFFSFPLHSFSSAHSLKVDVSEAFLPRHSSLLTFPCWSYPQGPLCLLHTYNSKPDPSAEFQTPSSKCLLVLLLDSLLTYFKFHMSKFNLSLCLHPKPAPSFGNWHHNLRLPEFISWLSLPLISCGILGMLPLCASVSSYLR